MKDVLIEFYKKNNLEMARAIEALCRIEENVLILVTQDDTQLKNNFVGIALCKHKGVVLTNKELLVEICTSLGLNCESFLDGIVSDLYMDDANLLAAKVMKRLSLTARGLYHFLINEANQFESIDETVIADYFKEDVEKIKSAISELINNSLLLVIFNPESGFFDWIVNPEEEQFGLYAQDDNQKQDIQIEQASADE